MPECRPSPGRPCDGVWTVKDRDLVRVAVERSPGLRPLCRPREERDGTELEQGSEPSGAPTMSVTTWTTSESAVWDRVVGEVRGLGTGPRRTGGRSRARLEMTSGVGREGSRRVEDLFYSSKSKVRTLKIDPLGPFQRRGEARSQRSEQLTPIERNNDKTEDVKGGEPTFNLDPSVPPSVPAVAGHGVD